MVSESCWLRNLLLELHFSLFQATLVYCDNVSAIYLYGNPVHQCTKHIELYIQFVREKVACGQARVLHVHSCCESDSKLEKLKFAESVKSEHDFLEQNWHFHS